jgi:hypothetical protein
MPSRSKPARSPRPRFFIRPATRNRKFLEQNHSVVYNTYLCEPSWCSTLSSPDCAQPADMSSITPQSFVDDGGSFTKRVPHGLDQRRVAKWISGGDSEVSGYTGSYIDDGADMLLPQRPAPGFGKVNTKFYKQRKRKEEKDAVWNNDVQKAISGDIQRNLAKLRDLSGVQVKRPGREHSGKERKKDQQDEDVKDTVTIPMPPPWGTFVIKAGDGRPVSNQRDGSKPPLRLYRRPLLKCRTLPLHRNIGVRPLYLKITRKRSRKRRSAGMMERSTSTRNLTTRISYRRSKRLRPSLSQSMRMDTCPLEVKTSDRQRAS